MNTQWRKIAGDFRERRLQIFLIALILMMGIGSVIAALNARAVLAREIAKSYERATGADIVLWFDKVDRQIIELVRARPNVAAAEPRATTFTRIASPSGEWFPLRLTILRDLENQSVNLVHKDNGDWPAKKDGIFIEQSGATLLSTAEHQPVRVRTANGEAAEIPVSGFVHDPAVAPSTQDRMIYGYVTQAVASALDQKPDLDQLLLKLKTRGSSSEVSDFADDLGAWLKTKAAAPLRVDALNNAHPHAMLMTAMLRVLEVLATIAFVCGATLAACVISLWMRREVRQVGVMKTLGARSWQLAGQYFALVAPLVVVAVVLAFPLGAEVGGLVVKYHRTLLNIDVADWNVPASLTLKELAVALVVPSLAVALPIWRAARMSPREAIQDPGILAPRGPIGITSRLIRMPGDRRWSFALRNSFRRPWRLALTLLALSAGGALLLTAHNNYESLMRVIDEALANRGHDIEVQLQRPAPAQQLETVARAVPGVEIAEAFRRAGVNLVTEDSGAIAVREGRRLLLCGYPIGTQLLRLPLREGRWPTAESTGDVVINRQVQEAVSGLQLGSEMTIKLRERFAKVRVAGIVEEIGSPVIYAPFPTFQNITALGNASGIVRVKALKGHEQAAAGAIEKALLDAHLTPGLVTSKSEFRASLDEHFAVVGTVMKMNALAATLVGAITLVATVCLGVLERGREIGVLRAIGAAPRAVIAIFLAEGGAVALLSAALAVAGGIYFARFLNRMAAQQLLHVAVPLSISGAGIAILSSGASLVILAVWLAVTRMLRLSVRDALAYE